MSGGVDSSVAAAALVAAGHDVVGATLKLWGGPSDSGCCSVADVEDARRVARHLGVDHHVFNFTDAFEDTVVGPYVSEHALGRTPNPCIECNRRVKFGLLLERSERLGFDALATGHHARVEQRGAVARLRRGADRAKDQSYVLAVLGPAALRRVILPVGAMTKSEVRTLAGRLGLPTALKPDSQDVCFIQRRAGRAGFLGARLAMHPADVVDATSGDVVGHVPAAELVTVGQRRGLGTSVGGRRRYALSVDVDGGSVTVGSAEQATAVHVPVGPPSWAGPALVPGDRAEAQTSAHGSPAPCTWTGDAVVFDEPRPLVAPGQTVALYDARHRDLVVGAVVAGRARDVADGAPAPSSTAG